MSQPAPFPYATLSRRALRLALNALRDAKRAAHAGDRAALKRARDRAQRHATTAQIFASAAGPDHPDAAALSDYHRRATAAFAGTLSLARPRTHTPHRTGARTKMTPQELKDTPSDVLAERLDAARALIGSRALAFYAQYPRACDVCDGAGLDLNAPTPPAGRPDTCPACTGATPARHPLDTSRQLSRAAREGAADGPRVDTSPAIFLATLRQIERETHAELIARGWSPDDDESADYCPDEDEPT